MQACQQHHRPNQLQHACWFSMHCRKGATGTAVCHKGVRRPSAAIVVLLLQARRRPAAVGSASESCPLQCIVSMPCVPRSRTQSSFDLLLLQLLPGSDTL